MNLVIDIGNTRIKTALFDGHRFDNTAIFSTEEELKTFVLSKKNVVKYAILSTVTTNYAELLNFLNTQFPTNLFSSETAIPLSNKYKSASTLGSDRLAAAIGANHLFPNENVLVIDSGTCLKFNFVNNQNEFIGGSISPGLQMRLKALNHFTGRLPLVSLEAGYSDFIGKNTNESILAGVLLGFIAEARGFIELYHAKFPDLKIILTGGDSEILEKELKMSIFAEPFLILKGLNTIIAHNHKL